MSGKYLLDTNIIIALFAKEQTVLNKLSEAEEVFISTPVLGEMYYGAYNSQRLEENIFRIKELETEANILRCNARTSEIYGKVKAELKRKGYKIPENDIWIAALALENNLILVSRDKHFVNIDNLKLEKW